MSASSSTLSWREKLVWQNRAQELQQQHFLKKDPHHTVSSTSASATPQPSGTSSNGAHQVKTHAVLTSGQNKASSLAPPSVHTYTSPSGPTSNLPPGHSTTPASLAHRVNPPNGHTTDPQSTRQHHDQSAPPHQQQRQNSPFVVGAPKSGTTQSSSSVQSSSVSTTTSTVEDSHHTHQSKEDHITKGYLKRIDS